MATPFTAFYCYYLLLTYAAYAVANLCSVAGCICIVVAVVAAASAVVIVFVVTTCL